MSLMDRAPRIDRAIARAVRFALVFSVVACGSAARSRGIISHADPEPPGTFEIPTRYVADRFFATPVTTTGDTVSLFLDTGGGTTIWEPNVVRLGLAVDSVRTSSGAYRRVVSLPAFQAARSVPDIAVASPQGNRLVVYPLTAGDFGAMIAQSSAGQLGQLWFDERIWTIDYPGRRILLHRAPPPAGAAAHRVALNFFTDSLGHRIGHDPRIPVVVDGDTLQLLFDTGATVWLTPDALARANDGLPAERAVSHATKTIVARWRASHPDWPVLEKADSVSHADMIRVPVVRIGGYDVGPVWFDALLDAPSAPRPASRRVDGTVGGSVLKFFSITVDYPRAVAQFERGRVR